MINKTKILKNILSHIQVGQIEVTFQSGESQTFGSDESLRASLKINNKKAISEMLSQGDIGFGRGYIENWWQCDDIVSLLDIVSMNAQHFEKAVYGNRLFSAFYKFYDFLKRNTIANSKKNIEYHYDLGNEFYFKWLDSTKTYSSALFRENESLEDGQVEKYRNIIKYIPNAKKILEIGCGWGGFMSEMLKENANIEIKGLTLSHEQYAFVSKKFSGNDKIQPIIQDYRNENYKYDAVVSIEMFEAVGMEYWETYMQKVSNSLHQNGVAIIQTITIDASVFEKYTKTSDFIRHFIFPGGMLPTKEIFESIAQKFGFEVVASENFGMSYRQTLLLWLENFDKISNELSPLGFHEKFIRKWRFYLAYCAAGFNSKRTDVYQFVLRKI